VAAVSELTKGDPAIHALKTRIMQKENPRPGAMIAGMPKIELDLGHAKRLLLVIARFEEREALWRELVDREESATMAAARNHAEGWYEAYKRVRELRQRLGLEGGEE
jgi:hypothetical protein